MIAKHPLFALLLPGTHLRLPETQLRSNELGAITLWELAPPGSLFFWDSKNGPWPDLVERRTPEELRDALESRGKVLARFATDDYIPDRTCEVVVYERSP